MRHRLMWALALFLVAFVSARAQTARATQRNEAFAVAGYSGEVPTVQINGKTYVDIESLARLTHGTLHFQSHQVVLTLPTVGAPSASAVAETKPVKQGFSSDFLRAAIEEMTEIREWRIAIVNAVQNNNPVADDWVAGFRRAAESKLAIAAAATASPTATDSDAKAMELLRNEFNNMRQLSDTFVAMHNSLTFTATDSFDNNPLDQKVLGCARALASMAASNQFQDDPSCH